MTTMSYSNDRISALPEDLLIRIVSRLNLQDAIRTSVLSHQWRYLWTYTDGMFDLNYVFNKSSKNSLSNVVTLVLNMHKARTIEEFKVQLDLEGNNASFISRLVEFGLKKHVKTLKLDLCSNQGCGDYALRLDVFTNYNGSLTNLHLDYVNVEDDDVLGWILCNSPLLQTLRVRHSSTLRELKVTSPLLKLSHLEIIDCREIRNLELHTTNLVSITYRGPQTSLCFKELHLLTRANFDHNFLTIDAGQLSCYFSRLKSLVLDLNKFSLKMFDQSEIPKLPLLENLEHLNVSPWQYHLKGYIGWCTMLLRSCPKLHRFVLKIKEGLAISDFADRKTTETAGGEVKYVHNLVKMVEITGYHNFPNYIELFREVLCMFPLVEKVVVEPLFLKRKSHKQSENGIFKVAELRDLLPLGAELVVV